MEKKVLEKIFPGLDHPRFEKINLNELVRQNAAMLAGNLKDPRVKQRMIDGYHSENGCISYGGWLENRSFMWSGTYLDKEQNYMHLGVDINVPSGETVHIPFNARIIDVWQDISPDIGWGKRVIFEHAGSKAPYFIIGHLANSVWYCKDELVPKDGTIGYIGTWPQNGNVFEHIHLQAVERNYFESIKDITQIDGYGSIHDASLAQRYPEPLGEIGKILENEK